MAFETKLTLAERITRAEKQLDQAIARRKKHNQRIDKLSAKVERLKAKLPQTKTSPSEVSA